MNTLRFISKEIVLIIFTLLLFLILPRAAYSTSEYNSGETVLLARQEIVNSDYFVAGNTVVISGTVNGDLYAAGANILIDGNINGDVLAAGGNVTINGVVNGNIRTAGGQIMIGSAIERNITAAGGTITINTPVSIKGSLVAAGGTVTLLSRIERDATIAGGQISLTQDATVLGKLNYWSDTPAKIFNSERINGGIFYHQTQRQSHQKIQKGTAYSSILLWSVISTIITFSLGVLLLKLVPNYTLQVTELMKKQPWSGLGIGFITMLLFPLAFILLLVTVVGIPLAFALLCTFLLVLFLNPIFIALLIGEKILPNNKIIGYLAGLIICTIISLIPIINIFFGVIIFFWTLGSMMITKKNLYTKLRKENVL